MAKIQDMAGTGTAGRPTAAAKDAVAKQQQQQQHATIISNNNVNHHLNLDITAQLSAEHEESKMPGTAVVSQ